MSLTHTMKIKSAAGIVREVEVDANAYDAATYVRDADRSVRVGTVACDDVEVAETVRSAEVFCRSSAQKLMAERKTALVAAARAGSWGDASATLKAALKLHAKARRI